MSPDLIIAFVQIFFVVGLVGMLWAWGRVWFYDDNLMRYKEIFEKQISKEDNKIILKVKKKAGDPLDERCRILEEVLADANGACRIPELHDLNEFTIQVEFASFPPSLLRIIISFLLIVGIFGTLSSVEGLLGNGNINIRVLKSALEPSMYAVGGTVLLLWARGLYDYAFRKYLENLNSFTMEKLFPALPMHFMDASHGVGPEHLQEQNRNFLNEMSDFKRSVNALESLCTNLSQEKELLCGKVKLLDGAAEGVTAMTVRIKENEKLHSVISKQHQTLLSNVPELVEDIQTKLNMLEQLNHVTDNVSGVFLALANNVEGIGKYMRDVLVVTEEIPAFVGEMRGYSESIREIGEMREKFTSASESLEEQIKKLTAFDRSISEQVEDPARVAWEKLQAILQVRQDQQNDFELRLKGYNAEFLELFASIQKSIDDFEIKSCNDLARELGKRTKKLGL